MTRTYSIVILALSFLLVSCGWAKTTPQPEPQDQPAPPVQVTETPDEEEMDYSGEYTLDTDSSIFAWAWAKVVGWGHSWVITATSGSITIVDNELTTWEVVIDMTTIASTDWGGNEKLDTHLKSDDFFDVENHPTSTLTVSSATENENGTHTFSGTLEILGVSNPIEFIWVLSAEDGITMVTSFTILRDDYGIGSGFKWAVLKDELEFSVSVTFTK